MEANKQPETNRHHMIWPRTAHESNANSRALREDPAMIARIHVDPHARLHNAISIVPLMDYNTAGRVRRNFDGDPTDPLHSMDAFMFSVEEANKHPKASELDRKIGELVIMAIDLQRPFIQEGIHKATIIDLGRLASRGHRAA